MSSRYRPHKKRYRGEISYIARCRVEKKLTQQQVADHLHLPRTSITRIENGMQKLPSDLAVPLAKLLECPLEDLLVSIMC